MNEFNEKEFIEICKIFNVEPKAQEKIIRYSTDSYFNKVKKAVKEDRRGEVVFCVIRPNGKVITVTCEEYPEGIFRIPTGGIGHHEDIIEAVSRETKEELGLKVDILKFLGALKIRFEYEEEHVMFYSYLFVLKEVGGRLLLDASDDEVSEVREADLVELQQIANSLNNLEGSWTNWGKFRYETTNEILKYLKNNTYLMEHI